MKYSFAIMLMFLSFSVFAEDDYMVIGPEGGSEKELLAEECSANPDTPPNDSNIGNDMLDE